MSGLKSDRHPASYRDPAGFVFRHEQQFYRAVQPVYQSHYEHLFASGLYEKLASGQWIIPHTEVPVMDGYETAFKILKPTNISFWTYPYEWSFEQLKAAALHTLKLAKTGLAHGMILKDANAYNIQFLGGQPTLIDSLSFEVYEEGMPWQALRQFCEQFLYPLLLMQRVHGLTPALFLSYPNGIPAKMVADVLPWTSRLRFNEQLYVHLPASAIGHKKTSRTLKITRQKILQNLNQLTYFIKTIRRVDKPSVWNNYYEETILSDTYLKHKTAVVTEILEQHKPVRVTDIGCNTGAFSILAARHAAQVISMDFDASCIDAFYLDIRKQQIKNIHCIVADLTNPSPAMGWANSERTALPDRLGCELCLALAVIHHLALTNNVPLSFISDFLAGITTRFLLIEFVPKGDPKAQLLLANKQDIYSDYSKEGFEQAFIAYFTIEEVIPLRDSDRLLYLLKKK